MLNGKHQFSFLSTDRLIFGIGEIARMTDISTRQLRYWEKRGYIKPLAKKEGETRTYNFKTVIAITSIKHFLDEGYTLQAAASKVTEFTHQADILKKFILNRYQGLTEIDGLPAIDFGTLAENPEQHVFGLITRDGAEIVIRPSAVEA
ncbi:MerR family transcriptional regulator [Agrilactobacillus fermenti]|uniref:MerR family transcriptional regulator n=1 Tax=Agrilactobacillus fermenti TaxID=2586909 RepID=UPI001E638441|nr:MerR family transcriptional regulator [Agrilactobacillus fermenti]MCD2256740.1 MerR family transcriptional regulator [Agrilactobacillus fermenti]